MKQTVKIFSSVWIAMIWAFIIGVSGCTKAPAPNITNIQNRESKASRIALDRYEMLKRLKANFAGLPLWYSGEYSYTVFFPLGRSDRMYLLGAGEGPDMLFCYQRKGEQEKRVYKVYLTYLEPLKGQPIRTASLLDYISYFFYGAYVLKGQVSRYARNDLATKRDYAEYSYIPYTSELSVWRISTTGHSDPNINTAQQDYSLPEDPTPFYERYGLPLAHGELS